MKKLIKLVSVFTMITAMLVLTACGGSSDELSDWAYIEDKGVLIVGLDDTFAPMGFRDENDEIVGFDIDLARAVAKEMGVEVEFQPIDWDAKEAELEAKNIDCIWNGMSATPERQESMSLGNMYFENNILVMSLDESINIKDASELADYNLGTQADSAALEAMQAADNYDDFKDKISEYGTYDEAILDMKAGRVDVVVIDEVYAQYNNKNKDTLYASDFNFGSDNYAVGFRKSDTELTAKFNEALQAVIDSGEAETISNNWFDTNLVINQGYGE